MGTPKSIRVSLRLTAKDSDLVSLLSQYKMHAIIAYAIRCYLCHDPSRIPLPVAAKNLGKNEVVYCSTVFREDKDEDIYRFLERIKKKSIGEVCRRLLRHVVDPCDIRTFLVDETSLPTVIMERPAVSRTPDYVYPTHEPSSFSPAPAPKPPTQDTPKPSSYPEEDNETWTPKSSPDADISEENLFDFI